MYVRTEFQSLTNPTAASLDSSPARTAATTDTTPGVRSRHTDSCGWDSIFVANERNPYACDQAFFGGNSTQTHGRVIFQWDDEIIRSHRALRTVNCDERLSAHRLPGAEVICAFRAVKRNRHDLWQIGS
jgi:hypothetical protein